MHEIGPPYTDGDLATFRDFLNSLAAMPPDMRSEALDVIRQATGWEPRGPHPDVAEFDAHVKEKEWLVKESMRFGYPDVLDVVGRYEHMDLIGVELRSDGVALVEIGLPGPGRRYRGEGSWHYGATTESLVIGGLPPGLPAIFEGVEGTYTRDMAHGGALLGPSMGDLTPFLERR